MPLSSLERAAELLRVMGHPVRLKLAELLNIERYTVGELAELIGQPPHVISQHLTRMRAHGLLTRSRDGRSVHYEVVHPSVMGVLRCIRRQVDLETTYQDGEAI